MSVYESGVSAYRDTTKWLVAFAPVTALITAAVTLGPALVTSTGAADGLGDWLTINWGVTVCGLAIFAGLAAILFFGAQVLSVAPTEIGQLQSPEFAPRLATAIGAGVTAPEFFDKTSFEQAMAELANALDQGTSTDALLARLRAPIEALRQWSIFDRVHRAFVHFCLAFVGGSLVIAAAVVAAASQLDNSAAIDQPTAVVVSTSFYGEIDLQVHTGCRATSTTQFTAVAGTWNRPVFEVAGRGCRFASRWRPAPGHVQIQIRK